ncbi:hypothetical protein P7K49_014264, partial [Saguinus oedipus]
MSPQTHPLELPELHAGPSQGCAPRVSPASAFSTPAMPKSSPHPADVALGPTKGVPAADHRAGAKPGCALFL